MQAGESREEEAAHAERDSMQVHICATYECPKKQDPHSAKS